MDLQVQDKGSLWLTAFDPETAEKFDLDELDDGLDDDALDDDDLNGEESDSDEYESTTTAR